MTIQGITEDDIANYLAQTPAFFERHAELLASVQLTSPHGQRAVSLQERQMEMLRERIKGLEFKIVEMIRHAQHNESIANRLQQWTNLILRTTDLRMLPAATVQELQRQFQIPQAALRLWAVAPAYAEEWFAQPVGDAVKSLANSLPLPYCGVNSGFEAATWFDNPEAIVSMAMVPLHDGGSNGSYGLLVLGSPDPTRYSADMGTEFLTRIGEIAGSGLARLRAD